MAENEKIDRTFLSSLSSGHSIESLISAPLTAVSKSNAMMLGGQAQFILDYCFKEKNGSHEPVMIKMNFSGNTPDGCFYIPLITILPLNNLAVDEVSVKFNVEITSAKTHLSTSDGTNEAKPEVIQKKSRISAKIGTEENGKRNRQRKSGGISVSLKAKQIPLTKGITAIIDLYSKNIITSTNTEQERT
ncbi:DUF2589 domain-containing protein [uncultured Treponema sp.]|uniref:DUF2589 domain-containing protein n=1 Tax=uncultured Treponema sp. TaxID=162155 RepID=UPI00259876C2|nr:DUF2589 domain-containing protein [uncultured Treponema sp.]